MGGREAALWTWVQVRMRGGLMGKIIIEEKNIYVQSKKILYLTICSEHTHEKSNKKQQKAAAGWRV